VAIRETARAPGALRDIFARELDVYAAEERAVGLVDLERKLEFFEDVFEAARLEPARAGLGVAVHRIADPQHLRAGFLHGLDRLGQGLLHVLRAKAMNQREAPRRVLWIERRNQTLQPALVHGGADLDAH